MKTIIDVNKWERAEHFSFFRTFLDPMIGLTTNVVCERFKRIGSGEKPNFLLTLHAILKAVNETEAFRYRIDKDGRVCIYDRIDAFAPMVLKGSEGYRTVLFRYYADRDQFIVEARKTMETASATAVFGVEAEVEEYNQVLVSCLPNIKFTALQQGLIKAGGEHFPIITIDKQDSDGMPMNVYVDHTFVDLHDTSVFINRVVEHLYE